MISVLSAAQCPQGEVSDLAAAKKLLEESFQPLVILTPPFCKPS